MTVQGWLVSPPFGQRRQIGSLPVRKLATRHEKKASRGKRVLVLARKIGLEACLIIHMNVVAAVCFCVHT